MIEHPLRFGVQAFDRAGLLHVQMTSFAKASAEVLYSYVSLHDLEVYMFIDGEVAVWHQPKKWNQPARLGDTSIEVE